MYSLEYKEAFYMHFRKFDPCGVKLERGGHIDPPPTYELTQKSPLLVGLTKSVENGPIHLYWASNK